MGLYRDSDAASTIRGMLLLDQLLDGGITAVRDVGTRNDVALKLKEAVERKMIDGPRIFWSGQLIASRGGHGDETTSTATGRPRSADEARVRIATGPDDWRLAVREQIRNGADWIKITAPYSKEEVEAAVAEAHLHGIRVAADAFGEFVDMGAEAGLDTLEHPLRRLRQGHRADETARNHVRSDHDRVLQRDQNRLSAREHSAGRLLLHDVPKVSRDRGGNHVRSPRRAGGGTAGGHRNRHSRSRTKSATPRTTSSSCGSSKRRAIPTPRSFTPPLATEGRSWESKTSSELSKKERSPTSWSFPEIPSRTTGTWRT